VAMDRLASLAVGGSAQVVGIDRWLGSDGYDPVMLLDVLAKRGLKRVFIEGGGMTVSRFLGRGCLDRLHLIVAPVLIGAGKPGLALPSWATMADCPRPPAAVHRLGDDVLWDLDLRGAVPPLNVRRAVSP
jgi:diaminohydroxyphosphoribosylaminopyrimidine deaminase/5-amino-6-(5-phosphoribosylamino)uracil reductase